MSRPTTAELAAWDHRYLWHPFTQMGDWLNEPPLIIERGEGNYLIDTEGRRYLDGVSSLWCNVHGHRKPELDAALKANRLDALLFPSVSVANIGARPGYPSITVPYAFVPVTQPGGPPPTGAPPAAAPPAGGAAFPPGFSPKPSPFGVSFTGTACSEPKLVELAFAFEQATKKRTAPPSFP